jgi:hypothetical protein
MTFTRLAAPFTCRIVAGDVAAAGAEVTIDGPVKGYVMSAGRSVTLDGRVGTDIWAAGETVTVDSPVGNNGMLAGLGEPRTQGGDRSRRAARR